MNEIQLRNLSVEELVKHADDEAFARSDRLIERLAEELSLAMVNSQKLEQLEDYLESIELDDDHRSGIMEILEL